jgi:hypothetical protein|tara:strand:- start:1765 stop:3078 length:1314 start_codon:yes stop_codon:yes gene_type:complete
MFRGGPVDSYGTGIASGLGYKKGGRVGMFEGGISTAMMEELTGGANKGTTQRSLATRGMDILKSARNRIYGIPYAGKFLKTAVGTPLRYAGAALSSPYAMAAAPVAAVGGLAYMNRPKTVEALQYMKQMNESGVFDETDPDGFQQYSEVFDKLNKEGTPLNQSEVGLLSNQKDIGQAIEDKDMAEFEAQTAGDLTADVKEGETAMDAVFRVGEEKAKTRKALEDANKPPPPLTNEQIKSQLAKDKELFKELLGADKARGKDIGDMLASASASFLGTGQVKEGFADLMDKVSKSGESRTEKINRTAAGLAINDYIAGKRSKENLQQILQKTKFGVDYSAEVAAAAKDLTKKTWGKALSTEAETLKEDVSKNKVIKNALFKKFEKPVHVISGFESDSFNEIDTDKLNVGFNIVSYAGGKIIIEKLTDQSVSVRTDLPVS